MLRQNASTIFYTCLLSILAFCVVISSETGTYDDMLVLACSWMSSPLGFTVKILFSGTPTSLYEYTSYTEKCKSLQVQKCITLMLLVLVVPLETYSCTVSKSSIERLCVWIEKVLDVSQTLNFEFFWLFLNDLPGTQKRANYAYCIFLRH